MDIVALRRLLVMVALLQWQQIGVFVFSIYISGPNPQ
jgi:hypothetical protein